MHNATEITFVLNDISLIFIILAFGIHNIVLIYFAPEIKKFIKEKLSKKSSNVGFKTKE